MSPKTWDPSHIIKQTFTAPSHLPHAYTSLRHPGPPFSAPKDSCSLLPLGLLIYAHTNTHIQKEGGPVYNTHHENTSSMTKWRKWSCSHYIGIESVQSIPCMVLRNLLRAQWDRHWDESESEVTQSCPTLGDHMDCSLPGSSIHGISPGKNTWVGCHFLLQEIIPTQGSNPGFPHCRQKSESTIG